MRPPLPSATRENVSAETKRTSGGRAGHTVSYGGAVKVVSNLDLGPRLSSMLTQMAAPPTALSGVGIGLRRWRAGGSRAMGRSRRGTEAAELVPVGPGLTSLQVPPGWILSTDDFGARYGGSWSKPSNI